MECQLNCARVWQELSTLCNNTLTLEQIGICDQQTVYFQALDNWSLGSNGQSALELSQRPPEYLEKDAEDSLPSVLLATASTIRELLQLGALPCAASIRQKVFHLLRDIPPSVETAQVRNSLLDWSLATLKNVFCCTPAILNGTYI